MAQAQRRGSGRRRLSLSVRLSLLVLFAALVPLAAVVGINDYFARGNLITQGRNALGTDANAKTTLIDSYMRERLSDGVTLAALPTAPAYLGCELAQAQAQANGTDTTQQQSNGFQQNQNQTQTADPCSKSLMQAYKDSLVRALAIGPVKDPNYSLWSLYDITNKQVLTSNADVAAKEPAAPAQEAAPVAQAKQVISPVVVDPATKHAFVRIYSPIVLQPGQRVVGYLRADLKLDYIWNIVGNEQGANGAGSYAFVTDENGIRIADGHANELFTAVQPLDAATQQRIAQMKQYGSSDPVQQMNLTDVQQSLASTAPQLDFQGIASPGATSTYQFVRIHMNTVPWSYFVLSPLSTVTRVADDQVRLSLISAAVIAVLAILIGLIFGRTTTNVVRGSVAELEGAAVALQTLAERQQASAGEQHWVVDACRTGLESVRYLSDAMNQAAHRIIDASNWFSEYWDRLTEDQARRTVQHLLELAHYIDEAARRQYASSERLDKAITVTMQVSDQLVDGANAATQSANQLDQVVGDLQRIVGGRVSAERMAQQASMETPAADNGMAMPMLPAAGQQMMLPSSGQQMMPAAPLMPSPLSPRQLAAPAAGGRRMAAPRGNMPVPPNPPSMWGRGSNTQSGWGEPSQGRGQMSGGGYGGYSNPQYGQPERSPDSDALGWGSPQMPANRDSQGWGQR